VAAGSRRWALIGAAVLVLGGGAIAAVLIADDSDPSEPAPGPAAHGQFPAVAPVDAAKSDERGKHAGAKSGRKKSGHAKKSSKRDGSADTPVELPGCPAGMSDAECATLRRAYEQALAAGSQRVKEGECPPGISQADCAALAKAYEQALAAGPSHPVKEGECPPGLSDADCAALGDAFNEARK
jgi:hypothetical protein